MSDRILAIGFEAEGERIRCADFATETALDGCTSAVVDPAAATSLWANLTDDSPAEDRERVVHAIQHRREEATELLNRGGTLVCILRPVGQTFRVVRPGPQGGRGLLFHAYSWLPGEPSLARLVIVTGAGREIRAADAEHPAWRLIEAQGASLRPVACVVAAELPSHWRAVATDENGRLVAFEVRVGQGRVLFIPPLVSGDPRERGALIEALLPGPAGAPEPAAALEWLSEAQLPEQAELAARVSELSQQIEALEREFIDVRRRHARLERINALLSARTPGDLASPAAAVLGLLGFHVETVDAVSLLVSSDEGSALVVLTAAEEGVPSDVYWDLIHRLDDGATDVSKGIIIANGFCTLPPGERAIVFPDLLRRGAVHREMCLVPTTELHRAASAVLSSGEDAALAARLRKALLSAIGPWFLDPPSVTEGDSQ